MALGKPVDAAVVELSTPKSLLGVAAGLAVVVGAYTIDDGITYEVAVSVPVGTTDTGAFDVLVDAVDETSLLMGVVLATTLVDAGCVMTELDDSLLGVLRDDWLDVRDVGTMIPVSELLEDVDMLLELSVSVAPVDSGTDVEYVVASVAWLLGLVGATPVAEPVLVELDVVAETDVAEYADAEDAAADWEATSDDSYEDAAAPVVSDVLVVVALTEDGDEARVADANEDAAPASSELSDEAISESAEVLRVATGTMIAPVALLDVSEGRIEDMSWESCDATEETTSGIA